MRVTLSTTPAHLFSLSLSLTCYLSPSLSPSIVPTHTPYLCLTSRFCPTSGPSLQDLVNSDQGHTVISMLLDINGFWQYDNRYSTVQYNHLFFSSSFKLTKTFTHTNTHTHWLHFTITFHTHTYLSSRILIYVIAERAWCNRTVQEERRRMTMETVIQEHC